MPNEENQQISQPVEERDFGAAIVANSTMEKNIIEKILDAKNILIALSANPSVDELAAAIGLSIYIDKMGKKATAIYSGATPNALQFLEPEKKFVDSADYLQDFVVAINKEKADHLRYKPDGDYVKIFITPYTSRITQEDLEFSYGDYNIDLVVALDVANGIELDSALREYGRIMHDAIIVNITTGKPGKFGEIEWSEPRMSSVSEMVADLVYSMSKDVRVEKDEATAFLTGIVAATDRFSNARTMPATMLMASKLMKSGANEQLIAKNVTSEVDNEMYEIASKEQATAATEPMPIPADAPEEVKNEEAEVPDYLKAAKEALSGAGAEVVHEEEKMLHLDSNEDNLDEAAAEIMNATYGGAPEEAKAVEAPVIDTTPKPEKIIAPSEELQTDLNVAESNKYGEMMSEALGGENANDNPAVAMTPIVSAPEEFAVPDIDYSAVVPDIAPAPAPAPASVEPVAPTEPEFVPTMPAAPAPEMPAMPVMPEMPAPVVSEMPMPEPIQPAAPAPTPEPTPAEALGAQPVMQDQVYGPTASDPGAFHIPGM